MHEAKFLPRQLSTKVSAIAACILAAASIRIGSSRRRRFADFWNQTSGRLP